MAIGRSEGSYRETQELYIILKTRRYAYPGLVALKNSGQTGALNILEDGLPLQLLNVHVKIFGKIVVLKELLPTWPVEDTLKILKHESAQNELLGIIGSESALLNLDISQTSSHSHYIERLISNRLLLNSDVFKIESSDVFVYKGFIRTELAQLVKPHVTRSSSSQLGNITCKHIELEDEEDWNDLQVASKHPIHLVAKEGNNYLLQRSTKVTPELRRYVLDQDTNKKSYISEDQFVDRLLSSTEGALLCDIPGMGKTWFLRTLATKISARAATFFIDLPSFCEHMIKHNSPDIDILMFTLEYVYRSKLAASVCSEYTARNKVKTVFLFDAFDEVHAHYVETTTCFLKTLSTIKSVNLVVSSRPHMRLHLEEAFNLVSYDILPFGMKEQVNYISTIWHHKFPECDQQVLKTFASQCVKAVKHIQNSDKCEILGVPLKCFMLSVVNEKHVRVITNPRRKQTPKIAEVAIVKSVCELYKTYVMHSIQRADPAKPINADLMSFHTYKSLQLLLPELAKGYMNVTPINQVNNTAITRVGLLHPDGSFLHRSFAEYFVGLFLAEFCVDNDEFCKEYAQKILDQFLRNVLHFSNPKDEEPPDENSDYSDDEWNIQDEFFGHIMFKPENLMSVFHKRVEWNRYELNYAAILSFMNELYLSESRDCEQIQSIRKLFAALLPKHDTNSVFVSDTTYYLYHTADKIFLACIEKGLSAVVSLLLELVKILFNEDERLELIGHRNAYVDFHGLSTGFIAQLLSQVASIGSPEMLAELIALFDESEPNRLLEFCSNFPKEFITPLEVAILSNDVDMVIFLNETVKFRVSVARRMSACLVGNSMSDTDMRTRVRIMGIVLTNHEIVSDLRRFGLRKLWYPTPDKFLPPYLRDKIPKPIVIKLNTRVLTHLAWDRKMYLKLLPFHCKKTLLAEGIENHTDNEIRKLLLLLIGTEDILQLMTPDPTESAQIFLARLDLANNERIFTEIEYYFSAFQDIHNLQTLKVFLALCPDLTAFSTYRCSFIHCAVWHGRLDWVEYLINIGHDVNQRDIELNSPLHCLSRTRTLEITQLLINNGADINAVNTKKQNILHSLLMRCNSHSKPISADWVTLMLDKGPQTLWDMPDSNEKTPLQVLLQNTGPNHRSFKQVLANYSSLSPISLGNRIEILKETLVSCDDEQIIELLGLLFGNYINQSDLANNDHPKTDVSNEPEFNSKFFRAEHLSQSMDKIALEVSFSSLKLSHCDRVFRKIEKVGTLKFLTEIFPDFSTCNIRNTSYLHFSVKNSRVEWVNYLLKSGHELNKRDVWGNTPITCLSLKHSLTITQLLVDFGADVYAIDNRGRNVAKLLLRKHIQKNDLPVLSEWILYMLKSGFYKLFNMKCKRGKTPLQKLIKVAGPNHPTVAIVRSYVNDLSPKGGFVF